MGQRDAPFPRRFDMDVQFLGSFTAKTLPAPEYPEVAIGGRSNVGKSSFLNAMTGRRGMARVSSKPGMTRTINFFLCRGDMILVDLPGYGYSRASRSEQARWARDIEFYLDGRENLKGLVLLGDLRHFPAGGDADALEWFVDLGLPLLVVLTKSDKLKAGEASRRTAQISGDLKGKPVEFVVFSAKTGQGKKEVWRWIEKTMKR
jgi:GTP-binding protein